MGVTVTPALVRGLKVPAKFSRTLELPFRVDAAGVQAKFKNGMLHHKVSSEAAKFIRQSATSGRSIEVQPLKIKENKVIAYKGLGLSVLFPPYKPACNAEMGCSSLLNESQNVISDIFSKLAEKVKLKSLIVLLLEIKRI